MDRLRRAALITRLIELLREQDSWCGETHIQKSTLFVQDLMEVPLGFKFILYKHGPFSFDLRDELAGLLADELIRLEPQWRYGSRITSTDRARYIQSIHTKTLAKYDSLIAFVAKKLGAKGVTELEGLATAFYVTRSPDASVSIDDRPKHVASLKPHISLENAKAAVQEVDLLIEDAQAPLSHR